MLAIDLNDFKLVNDALGHSAGDELLIAVADRLRGCVGDDDAIARLGGDEFAVPVEGVSDDARRVAERIAGSFDQPFLVEGQELLIRPSVGLAVAEPDTAGQSAEELLKRADSAMYVGKAVRVRRCPCLSEAEDPVNGLIAERLLAGGPQDSAAGAAAVRTLAELREESPTPHWNCVTSPSSTFAPGSWWGWRPAALAAPSPDGGRPAAPSRLQSTSGRPCWRIRGSPSRLIRALDERGLDPTEITEDVLLASFESTKTVLNELRQSGIRIAVDDIGSGYSALSYLREPAIDEIKLDRGLIAPISGDARAAAVVRAVLDLAHELDLTTVAEGVEDEKRCRDFVNTQRRRTGLPVQPPVDRRGDPGPSTAGAYLAGTSLSGSS